MQQILRTVAGRVEAEMMLGGRWLPVSAEKRGGKAEESQSPESTTGEQVTETAKMKRPTDSSEKQKKLDALAERIESCRKCELGSTRTHIVRGEGNPDARIVFVGEAPGQTEDETGRPFVGRAGHLLTKIIEAMGLRRDDVYICNILKCRPPGNRDPQATEIVSCIDYLYEQLDILEPEIIVALGAHAARSLLGQHGSIGDLRGRIHEYQPTPMAAPIKLVATYHPAYLLRNYTDETRRRIWNDMQMVLRELGLPVSKRQEGR